MIHVVGGAYFERCLFPAWNQLYGSGGRGAALLSQAGEETAFHTYSSDSALPFLETIGATYGFDVAATRSDVTFSFEYVHPLAVPNTIPHRPDMLQPYLKVSKDFVLRFGMIEGDAEIQADTAVYDPQSAFSPQEFAANGSSATRLAVIMNAYEASNVYRTSNVDECLERMLAVADVAIVKRGIRGALVATASSRDEVPAYSASGAFSIGSGDVFSAAFFYFWAIRELDACEASNLASLAVASYVESKALPLLDPDLLSKPSRSVIVSDAGAKVYLAGPFFNLPQRWLVTEARIQLRIHGLEVLSPFHDVGIGDADDVAPRDIEMLRRADKVLAIVDGSDEGTIFEVGFARALGIPVICYAQTLSEDQLKMMRGTGCQIVDDFAYAVSLAAQK